MGDGYDDNMDVVEQEWLNRGYAGSFQEAMDLGGAPLVTRTPNKCPACGKGLQRVWVQKWFLRCSGGTSFECWKQTAISYYDYEAAKDMDVQSGSLPPATVRIP